MNGFVQRATNRLILQMRRPSRIFFVYAVLVCIAGCNASVRRSGIPAGAQAALQEAIEDIDAGRYDELYAQASDEWRSQMTAEESKRVLEQARDKLGGVRNRNLQSAREEETGTAPVAGHSVVLIYDTIFNNSIGTPPKPITGIETFTLIEHGGHWALAKYYVSSSAAKS